LGNGSRAAAWPGDLLSATGGCNIKNEHLSMVSAKEGGARSNSGALGRVGTRTSKKREGPKDAEGSPALTQKKHKKDIV